METWILLLVGALIGAILSLLSDRFYKTFVEATPCVRVSSSFSYGIKGDAFNINIENRGVTQLPPYKIALFHPLKGTLCVFEHVEVSERFPRQMDVFSFKNLSPNNPNFHGTNRAILSTLTLGQAGTPERPEAMSEKDFGEWRLRLILTHSEDFVLFEDNRAGAAIAEIIRDIVKSGVVNPSGEQVWRVNAHNSWRISIRRWLRRWTRRVSRRPPLPRRDPPTMFVPPQPQRGTAR